MTVTYRISRNYKSFLKPQSTADARDTAKHPTMHRTAHSPPKELWSQMSIALRLRNSVIMCHTMVARIKTVMGRGGEVLRFWIYF